MRMARPEAVCRRDGAPLPVRGGLPIPHKGHVRRGDSPVGPLRGPRPATGQEDARPGVPWARRAGRPRPPQRPGPAIPARPLQEEARGDGHNPIHVQEGEPPRRLHNGGLLRDHEERDVPRARAGIPDVRGPGEGRVRVHRLLQQREDQGENKMDAPLQIQGGIHLRIPVI